MADPFVADCVAHARELIEGRLVILAGSPLAGMTHRARRLHDLGAARCLAVGTGVGTGPLPDPAFTESIVVPVSAPDMIAEMRATEHVLAAPPPDVVAALDRFDPDHSALVLITTFEPSDGLAGRAVYGPRRPEWVALEDKTIGDAMFDAAAVPRPPSSVVAASLPELRAAASSLDRGAGTVWAGDAREGFNGGGVFVRWIRDGDDGADAAAFFAAHCDHVRVAPFIDGLSCSVHGFVTDDGVAVFRPVELVNLRRPAGDRLQYAGRATFWDPDPADRETMRAAAARLGEHLRERVAYRGAFTLDGIVGVDGFVATECNPRPGAGLGYLGAALPDLPFDAVQYIAAAGDASWLRADDLEVAVVAAGDATRWGGGWTPITTTVEATITEPLVHDREGFRRGDAGEPADATLTLGPGSAGGFVRIEFPAPRTWVGPSLGPAIVEAFVYADAHHGTGIGPVTAARPAR